MAYRSALFLALLVFTTSSLAHGYIINGQNITGVNVLGRLACAVPGKPVPSNSTGLAGEDVALLCNGGNTTLGHAITDTSGFFQVVLNVLDGLLFDPSSCVVSVKLPIAQCNLFPPTGNLEAVVTLLNVVSSALGPVAQFTTGIFDRVAL